MTQTEIYLSPATEAVIRAAFAEGAAAGFSFVVLFGITVWMVRFIRKSARPSSEL